MEYIVDGDDVPQDAPKKPIGRPKGSFKPKMTNAERKQFIKESMHKILDEHLSHAEYTLWAREQKEICKRQANEYWVASWSLIKKKFEMDKNKLVLKHTQKYWDIYQRALETGDWTNARQSLNDLAKLQGLNEPDKVEVRGTTIKLNFGNPEQE